MNKIMTVANNKITNIQNVVFYFQCTIKDNQNLMVIIRQCSILDDEPSWCLELRGISAAETKLSAGDGSGDTVALLARGLEESNLCIPFLTDIFNGEFHHT